MSEKTVGILGGGQLAMMLAEAATKQSIKALVLAETTNEPAQRTASDYHIGSLKDIQTLTRFFDRCDVIAIESEFVDYQTLEAAQNASSRRPHIIPNITAIKVAQDKLSQKELFSRLHLPTAKHRQIMSQEDVSLLLEDFPSGAVLKWAKFGYDGKGNFVLQKSNQVPQAKDFCKAAFNFGGRVYAENFTNFDHELAMVFVRSRGGDFTHYPLVITVQENGVCRLVQGPATRIGIPPKIEAQAVNFGRSIGDFLQIGGAYAVEFFYSQKDGLSINEMAPRVHNSGHYTQDASSISQFENHVKAITGQGVKEPGQTPFFAMYNILGPFGSVPTLVAEPSSPMPGHLHWYGKKESRSGRKMGHINATASSLHDLQAIIMSMKEAEAIYWQSALKG